MFSRFIDKSTMDYILDYSENHDLENTLWLLPLIEVKLKEERLKSLKILEKILINFQETELDKKIRILYEIIEIFERYEPNIEYNKEEKEILERINFRLENY